MVGFLQLWQNEAGHEGATWDIRARRLNPFNLANSVLQKFGLHELDRLCLHLWVVWGGAEAAVGWSGSKMNTKPTILHPFSSDQHSSKQSAVFQTNHYHNQTSSCCLLEVTQFKITPHSQLTVHKNDNTSVYFTCVELKFGAVRAEGHSQHRPVRTKWLCPNSGAVSLKGWIWRPITSQRCTDDSPNLNLPPVVVHKCFQLFPGFNGRV